MTLVDCSDAATTTVAGFIAKDGRPSLRLDQIAHSYDPILRCLPLNSLQHLSPGDRRADELVERTLASREKGCDAPEDELFGEESSSRRRPFASMPWPNDEVTTG